jgi:hypothetical protein
MSPVGFSPQSASSTNFGQSEAASAGDADIEAPTISAKTATLDNRMVELLAFKNAAYPAYDHVAVASLRKRFALVACKLMGLQLRRSC